MDVLRFSIWNLKRFLSSYPKHSLKVSIPIFGRSRKVRFLVQIKNNNVRKTYCCKLSDADVQGMKMCLSFREGVKYYLADFSTKEVPPRFAKEKRSGMGGWYPSLPPLYGKSAILTPEKNHHQGLRVAFLHQIELNINQKMQV